MSNPCPICAALGQASEMTFTPPAKMTGQQVTIWDKGAYKCNECGTVLAGQSYELLKDMIAAAPELYRWAKWRCKMCHKGLKKTWDVKGIPFDEACKECNGKSVLKRTEGKQ